VYTKADIFMWQTGEYHSLPATGKTNADFPVIRSTGAQFGQEMKKSF